MNLNPFKIIAAWKDKELQAWKKHAHELAHGKPIPTKDCKNFVHLTITKYEEGNRTKYGLSMSGMLDAKEAIIGSGLITRTQMVQKAGEWLDISEYPYNEKEAPTVILATRIDKDGYYYRAPGFFGYGAFNGRNWIGQGSRRALSWKPEVFQYLQEPPKAK